MLENLCRALPTGWTALPESAVGLPRGEVLGILSDAVKSSPGMPGKAEVSTVTCTETISRNSTAVGEKRGAAPLLRGSWREQLLEACVQFVSGRERHSSGENN